MPRKPKQQTSVPGFGCIFQPTYRDKKTGEKKNSAIWWMEYTLRKGEKPLRRSTKCTNAADAYNELLKQAGRMAAGHIRESSPERVLIGQLLDMLIEHYTEGHKTLYDLKCRVEKHLRPFFGAFKAIDLTTGDLKRFIRLAREGKNPIPERKDLTGKTLKGKPLSNASINRCLMNLHKAFKLGAEHDPPLVLRIPKFPLQDEADARQGTLDHETYRTLRDQLAPHAQLALVIGYHTAMRIGEVLSIRRDQVDLKAGVIRLERQQVKNKMQKTAPIYGDMLPYIEMAMSQTHRTPYLIEFEGHRVFSIKTAWHAALRRIGMEEKSILVHDLRRTAATNMHDAGVPREDIKAIAGWKTDKMFERYNIGSEKRAVNVGKTMERYMESQATGASKQIVN